jgi:uncharacterized protein YjbI with pentapeptide repeats
VECDFSSSIFSHPSSFKGATFSELSLYRGTRFSSLASFDGTIFSNASFDRATFSYITSFANATFSGLASFASAVFSGPASFARTTFSSDVDFEGVIFSDWADFTGATFSNVAIFKGATFTDIATFAGAIFQSIPWFVNAEMKGQTSFEAATFSSKPPRFFNAKLHEGTVWRRAKWPTPMSTDEAGDFVDAYERLKLEMDRLKKHEDELDFFALELKSRRVLSGVFSGLPIALYGLLCNYGRSYFRPLVGLLVTVAVGAVLCLPHFGISKYPPPSASASPIHSVCSASGRTSSTIMLLRLYREHSR